MKKIIEENKIQPFC